VVLQRSEHLRILRCQIPNLHLACHRPIALVEAACLAKGQNIFLANEAQLPVKLLCVVGERVAHDLLAGGAKDHCDVQGHPKLRMGFSDHGTHLLDLPCAQHPECRIDLMTSVMPQQVVDPIPLPGPTLVAAAWNRKKALHLGDVHFAGLGTATGFPNGRKRPHRVAHQHPAPQFSGALRNFLCFGKIQPHRDFDNHVLARSQCGERLSRMKLAG